MVRQFWNQPDDDDDDDDQPDKPQLPKGLRQHVAKLEKELADLRKENGTLKATQRKTVIEQVFTSQGIDTRVASLVPESVEPSKDALEKWLKDHEGLFSVAPKKEGPPAEGNTKGEAENEDQGEADEGMGASDEQAAMSRIAGVVNNAQAPTKQADVMALVKGAKSREELDKLIMAAGGGYGTG